MSFGHCSRHRRDEDQVDSHDARLCSFARFTRRIVVKEGGEPVLTATFDEQNRLTSLEVRLEARADSSAAAPSESWDQAQLRRLLNG